jgi:hypothetical protein
MIQELAHDGRHQQELEHVEKHPGREEGANGNVEAVTEFQLVAVGTELREEALAPPPRQSRNAGAQQAANEKVGERRNEE